MLIVNDLKKDSKGLYNVTLSNKETYKFSEDVVVNYRLVKGKEISLDILNKAKNEENLSKWYNKAVDYSIKYNKGSSEIRTYLKNKEVSSNDIEYIINKLIEKKIIDDNKILDSIVSALVKSSNGKLLIRTKLLQKGYSKELIEIALDNIDLDIYYNELNKVYNKIKNKYNKYDDLVRIQKIKSYLYQRGYLYNEIDTLNIK